jgi:hypothetical protein
MNDQPVRDVLWQPDGRQSPTALSVQRGTSRLLKAHDFAVLSEFTLGSGRRADLIAIRPDGLIWIVEIKSSIEDFRVDQKWTHYCDYCDRFSFAIPLTLDPAIMPGDTGLIVADQYGGEILREASVHKLHGARRKALTLDFARVAAGRLQNLFDP